VYFQGGGYDVPVMMTQAHGGGKVEAIAMVSPYHGHQNIVECPQHGIYAVPQHAEAIYASHVEPRSPPPSYTQARMMPIGESSRHEIEVANPRAQQGQAIYEEVSVIHHR